MYTFWIRELCWISDTDIATVPRNGSRDGKMANSIVEAWFY